MTDPMTIALSGMRSAETRVGVAADNIANLRSGAKAPKDGEAYQGYTPKQVDDVSLKRGGVQSRVNPVDPAFVLETQGGTDTQAMPTVDLGQEQVNMMRAEHSYRANISIIQTEEEMQRELLDIKS